MEGFFKICRTNVLADLVKRKVVTKNEAQSLPTVEEIRQAFVDCIAEIAGNVTKSAPLFVQSLTEPDANTPPAVVLGSLLKDSASAALMLKGWQDQLEGDVHSNIKQAYKHTIEHLIRYRRGERKIDFDSSPQGNGYYYFDSVFNYLPEATRKPLRTNKHLSEVASI